jgi:tRNA pseudouridine38-40 synthase
VTLFEPAEVPVEVESLGPVIRVRATVAYDGRGFSGFAPNAGVTTVGGVLAEAIGKVVGHPVEITCAGRTDAGVHAWGQVISFDARKKGLKLDGLAKRVNKMLGPTVVVRDVTEAPDDFDARFSAQARRYRYLILNRPEPDPFLAHMSWHVPQPLDLPAMQLACDPFIGEHDFAAFCRRPKREEGREASLVRRVTEATWIDDGDGRLRFEIEAQAFCHQMVRSIVGLVVAVGLGRRKAGEVRGVIASGERNRAATLAPGHGLMLWKVRYG